MILGGSVVGKVNGSRVNSGATAMAGISAVSSPRDLTPATGLQGLWYPAIQAQQIEKKPFRTEPIPDQMT